MKTWLFNPFTYIAGTKALLIGWACMLATAFVGMLSMTHFDGIIDAHCGWALPWGWYLLEQLIDWGLAFIVFSIAGFVLSKSSVRLIDVAGTMALARWPALLLAFLGFFVPQGDVKQWLAQGIPVSLWLTSPAILVVAVWMIALMYQAFRVSCNLKGSKGILGFIAALLIAEIIAKVLFHEIHLSSPAVITHVAGSRSATLSAGLC
jgi:hypothetical protein